MLVSAEPQRGISQFVPDQEIFFSCATTSETWNVEITRWRPYLLIPIELR